MKRRIFLKTVSGATGAAALGAVSVPNTLAQGNKSRGGSRTNALEQVKAPKDSHTKTSTLRVRPPMWHPDGSPPEGNQDENLPKDDKGRWQVFSEEVIGKCKDGAYRSLPVEFEYKGFSKKWILGDRILDLGEPAAQGHVKFTKLVRELAVKFRKYNASLYRLRRIHYCNKYFGPQHKPRWPHANPDGGDGWDDKDPTAGTPKDIADRIDKAEQNWCTVTDGLDGFLEKAKVGYPIDDSTATILLAGLDTVAVNGYVIALRVVVQPTPGSIQLLQVDGSSSHVSISSPLSSSTT